MRALNLCGVIVVWSVIAVACGGESDIPKTLNGSEGGADGGHDGSDGGTNNQGGSGGDIEAGDTGQGGTTGGKGGGKGGSSTTGAAPGTGASPSTGGIGQAGAPTGGKGGTPMGGRSPVGGAPTTGGVIGQGGEAGTGGSPVEGCRDLQAPMNGPTYCSRNLQCGNNSVYLGCNGKGASNWWCDCSTIFKSSSYEVSGVSGADVCDAVIDFCVSGESPNPTGPEECSYTYESRQASYCELQERCVQSIELNDMVSASIASQHYINCSNDGLGRLSCYCDKFNRPVQVSGQDGYEACDTMADVCRGGELEFGEETCSPSYQTSGTGLCNSEHICTSAADLGGGATAISTEHRYISCSTIAGGGSTCACSGDTYQLRFDIKAPTNDLGNCNQYLPLCGDLDEIEPTGGDPICSPSYQSAPTNSFCDAGIDCKQPAVMGGEEIMAYGTLQANCSLDGDSFVCNCSASSGSAQIEVSASTAWDACTAAIEECPKAVEITIGDYIGGLPRPLD